MTGCSGNARTVRGPRLNPIDSNGRHREFYVVSGQPAVNPFDETGAIGTVVVFGDSLWIRGRFGRFAFRDSLIRTRCKLQKTSEF